MNATALSSLLLELYRCSRELPLAEFQMRALARLRAELPFDSAWWGVSAHNRLIRSSFTYQLPDHYGSLYQDCVCDTDTLAEATLACPDTAIHFTPHDMGRSPGLNRLTDHFGIQQSLCFASPMTPTRDFVTHLSLYRHESSPLFTEQERSFMELVAPHLWATWTSNWTSSWIVQRRAGDPRNTRTHVARAIADQYGTLYRAEPRFLELMHLEWPQWQGPELPLNLRKQLQTDGQHCGSATLVRHSPVLGLTLLEMQLRSALESLTPRELTVAAAFGEGLSHKIIASRLGLTPATVRHYLRRIYAKTNISNKAELANLLGTSA